MCLTTTDTKLYQKKVSGKRYYRNIYSQVQCSIVAFLRAFSSVLKNATIGHSAIGPFKKMLTQKIKLKIKK